MHANMRANLRRVLTGCDENLEDLYSADASIYLNYFQAHNRLLSLVTTKANDGLAAKWSAKYKRIVKHLEDCGATASEFGTINSTRSTRELEMLELKVAKLEKQVKRKEQAIDLMRSTEELLKQEIQVQTKVAKTANDELKATGGETDQLKSELKLKSREINKLQNTVELKELDVKLAQSEVEKWEEQRSEFDNELDAKRSRIQALEALLKETGGEKDELQAKLKQEAGKVEDLTRKIELQELKLKESLKKSNDQLERERSAIGNQLEVKQSRIQVLEALLEAVEGEKDELKAKLKEKSEKIADLNSTIAAQESQLQASNDQANQQRSAIDHELDLKRSRIQALEALLEAAGSEKDELAVKLHREAIKIEDLNRTIASRESDLQASNEQVEKQRSKINELEVKSSGLQKLIKPSPEIESAEKDKSEKENLQYGNRIGRVRQLTALFGGAGTLKKSKLKPKN